MREEGVLTSMAWLFVAGASTCKLAISVRHSSVSTRYMGTMKNCSSRDPTRVVWKMKSRGIQVKKRWSVCRRWEGQNGYLRQRTGLAFEEEEE